ncbi:MAG TPA: SLBB domain-containing protein [Gemmatimonadaceae bacterium]|nr:SLBB domain-containing protein [Gemmatimonadaceae bacterium]
MLRFPQCSLVVAVTLSLTAAPALLAAQQIPTPAQAQQLLQNNPSLADQLRQRLQGSGLTADQIRARLRAEGYPEGLLDSYLPGTIGAQGGAQPTATVFAAVRALGIVDSTGVDSLMQFQQQPEFPMQAYQQQEQMVSLRQQALCDSVAIADSLMLDSLRSAADSALADSLLLDSTITHRLPPPTLQQLTIRAICRAQDSTRIQQDSGFAIFGLDMFKRNTSQFEPNLAGPVDSSYQLGPGDELVLILTGDVEAAYTLDITREGFIVIPQVGQLYVANLTLGQLNNLLYTRLGKVYSGVKRGARATTHFAVSVARLRTNQVFVVGDVTQPGSYQISSAGTALTALYAAGGPTENGSLRRVLIRRGGRVVDSLDVYGYLLHGDASHDVRLQSGDVVFVPVHGPRVRVVGEIIRPATYELAPGESLQALIQDAGGYTPAASHRRVQIERIVPPAKRVAAGHDRIVMDISSEQLGGADDPPVALAAGDVVRVFPIAERVRNRINVTGDVWSPGSEGFTSGMHLSDALKSAGGVRPDVYAGEVLITRLLPDSSRVQLRATLRDSTGAVLNDPELHEDDQIHVFSVAEFRPRRYVTITGAVQKSGRVPYRDGMTLRDLVLLAGGLDEGAYLNDAEIARLPENRAGGVTATTIKVPLDSSYLFERGASGKFLGPPGLPAPAGPAPEVPLKPYDNVLILHQPNWELQRTVAVTGEVKFPGRYALLRKGARLADVIKRAGGFTGSAYPEGVVFYRHNKGLGRIGVDLPAIMRDPQFRDDLILQDGDSIYIPAFTGVVTVTGAVNSPVAVAYVPGQDLDGYVRAAGGPAENANMARAYVRQPSGKVQSVRRRRLWPDWVPKPKPGSVVNVPAKTPGEKSTLLANLGVFAQLAGSLVAIIAILHK